MHSKKSQSLVQARTIIRLAHKHGLKLCHYAATYEVLKYKKACARTVLAYHVNHDNPNGLEIYEEETAKKLQVDIGALDALERGFEHCGPETNIPKKYRRYYRVGQKVAQLAGL